MMKSAADRLTLFVAAFGVAISVASLCLAGKSAGFSTTMGSVLALANLMVLRTLVLRVVAGEIHSKMPLVALIFLKMGVFVAIVCLAIVYHWVEPIAFTVGLSSLVVGLISGSLTLTRVTPASSRSES
jgi:hypothetical protein